MKKFQFELQEILNYREYEEEQAQIELGKALAVENEIQSKLEQIAMQYANLKTEMKGSTDFEAILNQSKYTNLLNYQKEELLKQLAQAKLVSEEKRSVLREVMKKTTALRKMKEQELADYNLAADNEENNEVEDLTTTRYKVQN